MVILKYIEINNFRSISKMSGAISPNHLNILVGQNDVGKSNFLKALNLFFNNETEIGVPFRFIDDFSKYAIVPQKKAAEITIKLTFTIPKDRFNDAGDLVWTKIWRESGIVKDTLLTLNGREPKGTNRANGWVRKTKYKYVPATRGAEYFNHLMGNLHDALSEITPTAFSDASKNFIDGLKNQIDLLVNDIANRLGYSSEIGMPSDFKSLFSTLDFGIQSGGTTISLNKRGDGIKAQHIPVILKFIANHYKSVSGRSIITPDTIWGFEEPENNMEMSNSFKLAKIFASYSDDIQIFINTHSPAFYSLAKDYPKKTSLFLARKNGQNTLIQSISVDKINELDEEVGILPIISEYIKKEIEERSKIETRLYELEKKIKEINKPALVTEGKTDVLILNTAWNKLFPDIPIPFQIFPADNRTDNSGGNGGYSGLNRLLESVRPDAKIHIALYDCDQDGKGQGYDKLSSNFQELTINDISIKKHQNAKSFAILLPAIDEYTQKFKNADNLQIEFYFDEDELSKKINSKGLILNKGKVESKVRGKLIKSEECEELEFMTIDSNSKLNFAQSVVPTLELNAFNRFKKIFELISKILETYATNNASLPTAR